MLVYDYQPSPAVLRWLRLQAELTQDMVSQILGVKDNQIYRWEKPGYGGRVPADVWREAGEPVLALCYEDGDQIVYLLAVHEPEHDAMRWLTDDKGRFPVFVHGGLALSAALALTALNFPAEAVPVGMDYV